VVNASGGTTNYRILSGFRLKSLSIWASPASLGATATASVEWLSENGPSVVVSDTSVGTAQPLVVNTSPPPGSLAGYWSYLGNNEATVLAILNAPAGAVVDITYETILCNGETALTATTTNSGSAGKVYMTYLTGVTSTIFVPQSYLSLT
jgi:hypothetical protein